MLKIELYGPGSNTDVIIAFDPLPPDKVTVGAVVYPEPEFVILIDVMEPPLIVAVAVAAVPLGGGEMITFGAVVYPVPPELIITLSTEDGPDPLPLERMMSVSALNPDPFSSRVKFFGLQIPTIGVIDSL